MVNYTGASDPKTAAQVAAKAKTDAARLMADARAQANNKVAAAKASIRGKTTVTRKWAPRTNSAPIPTEQYTPKPIPQWFNPAKVMQNTEPLAKIITAPIRVTTPEKVLAESVAKQANSVINPTTAVQAQAINIVRAEQGLGKQYEMAKQRITTLPIGERALAKKRLEWRMAQKSQKIAQMRKRATMMQQRDVERARAQANAAGVHKTVSSTEYEQQMLNEQMKLAKTPEEAARIRETAARLQKRYFQGDVPKFARVRDRRKLQDTSKEYQRKKAMRNSLIPGVPKQDGTGMGRFLNAGRAGASCINPFANRTPKVLTPEQRNRASTNSVKKKALYNKEMALEARYKRKVEEAKRKVQNEKSKMEGVRLAWAQEQARNKQMLEIFKLKSQQTNKPDQKSLYDSRAKATVQESQLTNRRYMQMKEDVAKLIRAEINRLKIEKVRLMQELADYKDQLKRKLIAPLSQTRISIYKPEVTKATKKFMDLTTLSSIEELEDGDKRYDMGYISTSDE